MTSESACQKILCKLANHMGLYLEQTTEKREVFSSSVVWINCLTLRHKIVKWLVRSDEVWNWRKPIMYQNWSMQGKKCCVFLCRHVLKKQVLNMNRHILLICILSLSCPREATSYFTELGFVNHMVVSSLKSLKFSFLSYKTLNPAALRSSPDKALKREMAPCAFRRRSFRPADL